MSGERRNVTFEDALEVIRFLAEDHQIATGRTLRSIVVIGGTAMAAHTIRPKSEDVDVYIEDVDDAVIERTTKAFRPRHGRAFKIDATPANTLWGAIAIPDLDASPRVATLNVNGCEIAVRALGIETMYLVKVAADRAKDQPDIADLAQRTTYAATLGRARELFRFYADRGAFPAHAERLARYMARDHKRPLADVDRDFGLAPGVAEKVQAIRTGMASQFEHALTAMMKKRPDLISFDPRRPMDVRFDAVEAGAGDEIVALMRTHATTVRDLATNALKTGDPKRHMARLAAVMRTKDGYAK